MLGKTKLRILQLLVESPSHGYALAKDLRVSISSIYEHLKELEHSGFILSEEKGDKKNYRLTESGRLLLKALKANKAERQRDISGKTDTKTEAPR